MNRKRIRGKSRLLYKFSILIRNKQTRTNISIESHYQNKLKRSAEGVQTRQVKNPPSFPLYQWVSSSPLREMKCKMVTRRTYKGTPTRLTSLPVLPSHREKQCLIRSASTCLHKGLEVAACCSPLHQTCVVHCVHSELHDVPSTPEETRHVGRVHPIAGSLQLRASQMRQTIVSSQSVHPSITGGRRSNRKQILEGRER